MKPNAAGHKSQVVRLVADSPKGDGYGFRGWYDVTIETKFTLTGHQMITKQVSRSILGHTIT